MVEKTTLVVLNRLWGWNRRLRTRTFGRLSQLEGSPEDVDFRLSFQLVRYLVSILRTVYSHRICLVKSFMSKRCCLWTWRSLWTEMVCRTYRYRRYHSLNDWSSSQNRRPFCHIPVLSISSPGSVITSTLAILYVSISLSPYPQRH